MKEIITGVGVDNRPGKVKKRTVLVAEKDTETGEMKILRTIHSRIEPAATDAATTKGDK